MNNKLKIRANAKVNLSLDVTGRRDDGYHFMDMVNRSVTLRDELELTRTPGHPFSIASNARYLPTGEKNLVWKTAEKLSAAVSAPMPEVHIFVQKRIPTQAGLGGGSADAAAALAGLNRLCGYGLPQEQLLSIGAAVGADVPFCLIGGCSRVQGIGERLLPLEDRCRYLLLLAMPRFGHSTKEVFALCDAASYLQHPDTDAVAAALAAGDLSGYAAHAANLFEPLAGNETTASLCAKMRAAGALHAAMTGTGSAVFGIFTRYRQALACRTALREENCGAWLTTPAAAGVEFLR